MSEQVQRKDESLCAVKSEDEPLCASPFQQTVKVRLHHQGRIQKIQKEGAESPTLRLEWKLHFNLIV